MHRDALLVAAVLVTLAAGCKYKVVPGKVEKAQATNVTGSIQLVEAPDGDYGWPSASGMVVTGGGCLVYQDPGHRQHCISHDECNSPQKLPEGAESGYCELTQSAVEGTYVTGTCWFKQAKPDHCFKSKMEPLVINEVKALPVVPEKPFGPNTKLQWRVLTCQGIVTGGCAAQQTGGTEGKEFRFRFGLVREP